MSTHIVDISHPSFEDHIISVNKILSEINCHNKYSLMIFNKIDNYKQIDFNDSSNCFFCSCFKACLKASFNILF